MKKVFYSLIILVILSASILVGKVSAQSRLIYPIPDLGYCRDAKECFLYCEIPQNKAACWSYSKYKVGSDVLGVTTMNEEEKRMMEIKAKQYNITFPIADLGNCAGPQECRDFCEEPDNKAVCMDFSKKKGLHKEIEREDGMDAGKRDELVEKAKTELGCTSKEACNSLCDSDPTLCEAFAKKHGVYKKPPPPPDRYTSTQKIQLIEKAKTAFGCTSMESCKVVCEKNPQACMAFAKKHGFDKNEARLTPGTSPNYGTQRFGKGGCNSEESCKKYCQEHPDECPGFKGYTKAIEGSRSAEIKIKKYIGPSGCRNEAECKSWCNDYPDKCPGFSETKTREDASKREYELRKHEIEQEQEGQNQDFESNREMMQQRTPSSGGGSQYYTSTSTRPGYNTTQPSSDTYTPPATHPAAP